MREIINRLRYLLPPRIGSSYEHRRLFLANLGK